MNANETTDNALNSQCPDDLAVIDLLPIFQGELLASVRSITSAIDEGDERAAQCLARDLRIRATAFGFESIAELAENIGDDLNVQLPPNGVAIHLLRLRVLCQRYARRG